jgi:hypothetical protein
MNLRAWSPLDGRGDRVDQIGPARCAEGELRDRLLLGDLLLGQRDREVLSGTVLAGSPRRPDMSMIKRPLPPVRHEVAPFRVN